MNFTIGQRRLNDLKRRVALHLSGDPEWQLEPEVLAAWLEEIEELEYLKDEAQSGDE
jgi:hypothetical protein